MAKKKVKKSTPGPAKRKRSSTTAKRKAKLSAAQLFASESDYLKGIDVDEPFTTTITEFRLVDFDDGQKSVLDLEDSKSVVLNKTNGRQLLADLDEDDPEKWIGCQIEVFTERVRNPKTGDLGPAVRVSGVTSETEEEEVEDDDDFDGDLD